jgi:ribosomal protein RSM22 (predicted rRNA methylase)
LHRNYRRQPVYPGSILFSDAKRRLLRAHEQLKSAKLPYEDEKFSYVALTRAPVAQHHARVLAQPIITKSVVTAKLCTVHGVVSTIAPRREASAYARFRWGDIAFEAGATSAE